MRVTPIFDIGDVVRVPFPYVDMERREVRPALVISRPLGPELALLWTMMITSAANRGWAGDISLEEDHRSFGLPVPSVIRCEKIAVVEAAQAERVGRLSREVLASVHIRLRAYLR